MRIEPKEVAEGLDYDDGIKTLLIFVKAIFIRRFQYKIIIPTD
jgi:hypothetical protein